MVITSISKIKDNVHILMDNGQKLILRYEIFLKNGFRKGDEITEKDIASLIRDNQLFYIKESAFRILGRRLHSQKELERKLMQRKYDKELISEVLLQLKENHYLDDEKFAREYAEEKIQKKLLGFSRIRQELMEKGVSKEIIQEVLNEKSDNDESDNALRLAEKKLNALKGRNLDKMKLNQRLYSFLASKGFNYEIIRNVLDKLEF
ncbi:MAG: regulatory protein RecX [Bacillota bacterium]